MVKKFAVLSGGPGTGKSSVIDELERLGHNVLRESARMVWEEDKGIDRKAVIFQNKIFAHQKEKFKEHKGEGVVFSDRGFGDTLAYYDINGLETPKEFIEHARKNPHDRVFVMSPLGFIENDEMRNESIEEQNKIHDKIIDMYENLDYEIISVPPLSIKERVEFILSEIGDVAKEGDNTEMTFAMIKPDAIERELDDVIMGRLGDEGLCVEKIERKVLSRGDVEKIYPKAKSRIPHLFDDLVAYLTRGDVILLQVRGVDAVKKVSEIRGASNPRDAKKETIRGKYSGDKDYSKENNIVENIFHSSDDTDEAKEMLEYFFGGENG